MNENIDPVNVQSVRLTDNAQKKRRSFLKKAVYAAPTLVAMGTLTAPKKAKALPPPGPSNPWPPSVSLDGSLDGIG